MTKKIKVPDYIPRVSIAGWLELGFHLIKQIPDWDTFTGEALRFRLTQAGLPLPPEGRWWGVLIAPSKKKGLIEDTGDTDMILDPNSNGRFTSRLWERTPTK